MNPLPQHLQHTEGSTFSKLKTGISYVLHTPTVGAHYSDGRRYKFIGRVNRCYLIPAMDRQSIARRCGDEWIASIGTRHRFLRRCIFSLHRSDI